MVNRKTASAPQAPSRLAPKKASRLKLRPLARVERISLFEREIRERLSKAALDLVFERAEVISEGQRATRGGKDAYFGSTMLTLDLEVLATVLRDPCDAGTAKRLATLIGTDASVAARVKSIAGREAARLAANPPRAVNTEMTVSARGVRVFIDVDVEAVF